MQLRNLARDRKSFTFNKSLGIRACASNNLIFDDPEIEYEFDDVKRRAFVKKNVAEIKAQAKICPKEQCAHFIWECHQNDFIDEYMEREGIPDNHEYLSIATGRVKGYTNGCDILRSINKLKRRYKNYYDWLDALEIWEEYYEYIEGYYGNFEIFKEMAAEGTNEFPYKERPKLKHAKRNKFLVEMTEPISRINKAEALPREDLKEIVQDFPYQIEIYEDYYESLEIAEEINANQQRQIAQEYRLKNYLREKKSSSYFENNKTSAIMDYFTTGSTEGLLDRVMPKPLSEDVAAMHQYDGYEPELRDELMGIRRKIKISLDNPDIEEFNEQMDKDYDALDVYSYMAANGWDVGGLIDDSGMDETSVEMFHRKIPQLIEDDSHDVKKMKKLRSRGRSKSRS